MRIIKMVQDFQNKIIKRHTWSDNANTAIMILVVSGDLFSVMTNTDKEPPIKLTKKQIILKQISHVCNVLSFTRVKLCTTEWTTGDVGVIDEHIVGITAPKDTRFVFLRVCCQLSLQFAAKSWNIPCSWQLTRTEQGFKCFFVYKPAGNKKLVTGFFVIVFQISSETKLTSKSTTILVSPKQLWVCLPGSEGDLPHFEKRKPSAGPDGKILWSVNMLARMNSLV